MAEFPALPFWTDAYLADTQHLTNAEHGLYLRLLITIWRSPNCRIPNDEKWIARRFKDDAEAVLLLCREFCVRDGNWIWQKRLKHEWGWLQKKRQNNRASAKSRWDNNKVSCERISNRNAPTPTPTPISKKEVINGFIDKGLKKDGPPKHGARSEKGYVFLHCDTPEYEAHAEDYKAARGKEPKKLYGTGSWFLQQGEQVH